MNSNYESPFSNRYGSKEMRRLFSPDMKFRTWRWLWVILAKAEKELGLPITDEQITELERKIHDINYIEAEKIEMKTHHDVMAHIKAYGLQCPKAAGIIHLGATSSYITDNTDVIIMRDALKIVDNKLFDLICDIGALARKYKDVPILGYTHYQPAQPTTVGKRMTMWLQDLWMDMDDLRHVTRTIKTLGCKGATGTQASFLKLFDGDHRKVYQLDKIVCEQIGIYSYPITGQTYPRKLDKRIYDILSSIAVSTSKMANDIRLMQHDGEICEGFGKSQVGSSAMAYKKNPLNCEKVVALSRRVITDSLNPALTASVQWLERTLDDSANRRLVISEGFLAIDEILDTCISIINRLVINEKVIEANLERELPFLMSENVIMELAKSGVDRQSAHELIRQLSVKSRDTGESMLNLMGEAFSKYGITYDKLVEMANPSDYVGCARVQTRVYLGDDSGHEFKY